MREWPGIVHASATGSSREGHGSVTEVRRRGVVRPLPNGQESAVILIRPYDDFRTPQELRCSLLGHTPSFEHRRDLRGSKWSYGAHFEPRKDLRGWKYAYGEGFQPGRSLTVRISRSPARKDHGSPTSCRPCAASLTNPSRPGRLIAVTASQDRDETPRTALGLPPRPEERPEHNLSRRRSPPPLRATPDSAGSARGSATLPSRSGR